MGFREFATSSSTFVLYSAAIGQFHIPALGIVWNGLKRGDERDAGVESFARRTASRASRKVKEFSLIWEYQDVRAPQTSPGGGGGVDSGTACYFPWRRPSAPAFPPRPPQTPPPEYGWLTFLNTSGRRAFLPPPSFFFSLFLTFLVTFTRLPAG